MGFRRSILILSAAIGLLGTHMVCHSASDSQNFRVNVPARISIVPPNAGVTRNYGGSGNADISFPRQNWTVKSNSVTGATVLLESFTCFRHVAFPTFKRDGRLAVRVNSQSGPALWAVTRASDTTNFAAGDENARVQVVSNKAGQAELGLTVTFITGVGGDLNGGDYTMTVVGTITSN